MRRRSQAFEDLVLDAVEDVEEMIGRSIEPVQVAVEEIPVVDAPVLAVPLARYDPGSRREAPLVVIYRRPVEARAEDPLELSALVYDVVCEQLAQALGLDPDELR